MFRASSGKRSVKQDSGVKGSAPPIPNHSLGQKGPVKPDQPLKSAIGTAQNSPRSGVETQR